jgi:holo-[acyl-carrier protein] synthase
MIVGLGVDVVEIRRIRQALKHQGERFIRRIFTEAEQEFCEARRDPAPHYAVRFAAKEALFKALGTGWAKGLRWQDVEVARREQDAPILVLSRAAERQSQELGTRSIHLSLSHSDDSALAVVILED